MLYASPSSILYTSPRSASGICICFLLLFNLYQERRKKITGLNQNEELLVFKRYKGTKKKATDWRKYQQANYLRKGLYQKFTKNSQNSVTKQLNLKLGKWLEQIIHQRK